MMLWRHATIGNCSRYEKANCRRNEKKITNTAYKIKSVWCRLENFIFNICRSQCKSFITTSTLFDTFSCRSKPIDKHSSHSSFGTAEQTIVDLTQCFDLCLFAAHPQSHLLLSLQLGFATAHKCLCRHNTAEYDNSIAPCEMICLRSKTVFAICIGKHING